MYSELVFSCLQGLDKEWSNLTALVTHHTVMREMLPCTLRLPRKAKNPTFRSSDKDDREEDPDYQRLSDFSSMMAQLKMWCSHTLRSVSGYLWWALWQFLEELWLNTKPSDCMKNVIQTDAGLCDKFSKSYDLIQNHQIVWKMWYKQMLGSVTSSGRVMIKYKTIRLYEKCDTNRCWALWQVLEELWLNTKPSDCMKNVIQTDVGLCDNFWKSYD